MNGVVDRIRWRMLPPAVICLEISAGYVRRRFPCFFLVLKAVPTDEVKLFTKFCIGVGSQILSLKNLSMT